MKTKEIAATGLRIVTQYRAEGGFVYELEREGALLDLRMRRGDGSGEVGWRVEARNGRGTDSVMFAGAGSTPGEALQHAGAAWNEHAPGLVLPSYEWEQVARLLASVGAL